MKKRDSIMLLICCVIYTVIYMIYISTTKNILINLIQFLVIYVPFFITLTMKDKKFAIYIALAFCIFELFSGFLTHLKNIIVIINNPKMIEELFSQGLYLGFIVFSQVLKVFLIINIFKYFKKEPFRYVKIILLIFVLMLIVAIFILIFKSEDFIFLVKEYIFSMILFIVLFGFFRENKLLNE